MEAGATRGFLIRVPFGLIQGRFRVDMIRREFELRQGAPVAEFGRASVCQQRGSCKMTGAP